MTGYYRSRKLYRSRDGAILGVCKGIAEWRDLPVDMVRLAFVLLCVLAGLPIWVYFILALVLPVEPESWHSQEYRHRRGSYRETKDDESDNERDWDDRFSKGL